MSQSLNPVEEKTSQDFGRQLKIFSHITEFVSDLNSEFGTQQRSLKLYNHLLSKVKVVQKKAIEHNIELFSAFIQKNQEAILKQDASKLTHPCLFYSAKAYINVGDIITKHADADTKKIIWKHLIRIATAINPSCEAVSILKKTLEDDSNEGKFLNSLVKKVETSIDPKNTNPMESISQIMSSGVFTDIMKTMTEGMSDGKLDIEKLFGTLQGALSSLSGGAGGQMPDISGLMNMASMIPQTPVSAPSETASSTSQSQSSSGASE
jgi:hypothetical protein